MHDGPLPARLAPPRPRPSRVARPRLPERIEEAVRRGADVLLVAAPAGSGKTVLLASWAAARGSAGPVAWLSLESGDADPGRFVMGLAAALEGAGVTATAIRALLASVPPVPGAVPPSVEAVAAAVLADLAAPGRPVTLVLDDLHAAEGPIVDRLLRAVVDGLPEDVVLAIGTRADPGLGIPRLRAAGRLIEVRASDLAFTPEETEQLLRVGLGLDALTDDQVRALGRRTEGWAAGLQLAGLSLAGRDPDATARFIGELSGSHRHLLDYLVEEVVGRQPPEVRRALERTSIASRLTAGLVEALVAGVDGAATLATLERANLFLVALDAEGRWYRYHALFAEGLRHMLARAGAAEVAALHATAAGWFEAAGWPEEATEHALAGADWVRAARLIRSMAPVLVGRGEQATLERWLGALPAEVIAAAPGLDTDLATLRLLRGDLDGTEAVVAATERSLAAQGGAPADPAAVGRMLGLGAAIAVARLESERALERAERALTLLPASAIADRASVLTSVGRVHWQLGDLEAATTALLDAHELATASGNVFDRLNAEVLRAHVSVARGDLAEAEARVRAILAATEGIGIIPRYEAASLLATLLRQAGRLDEAAEALAAAADLGERIAAGAFAIVWRLEAVRLASARGDRAALREALDALVAAGRRLGGERVQAATAVEVATLSPLAAPAEAGPAARGTLSARELEVLRLAAAGRSNRQIADELVVTLNTVKAHLHHIATKLDTPNRTATVARARELGLLP